MLNPAQVSSDSVMRGILITLAAAGGKDPAQYSHCSKPLRMLQAGLPWLVEQKTYGGKSLYVHH